MLTTFLLALAHLSPYILTVAGQLVPVLARHPAAVPHVIAAVDAAERMGGTGPQKLDAAVSIASASLSAAQAFGAPIDAAALAASLPDAVNAIVKVVNDAHKGAPAGV